ncbi:MAG: sulfite exporter TauE/SafE family protein [Pedobacter sp.]|nr:MAG: sulfite exporter TauE/SafE family protein [Pedobacter sp.]
MSFYVLGLWIGFLGSLHCGLMCGPLVLALPIDAKSSSSNFWMHMQYQIGRILTYGVFGFILGSLGTALTNFTGHGLLTLILGIILFSIAFLYLISTTFRKKLNEISFQHAPFVKYFSRFYGTPIWPFMAGVLNGLLPCGMVYLALATAINSKNALESALFMISFGVGTLPLLLSVAFGGVYLKRYFSFDMRKMLPWFAMTLGILLIFRSLHLGIPFLSPEDHLHYGNAVLCY